MARIRVQVNLDEDFVAALDRVCELHGIARSQLVERAILDSRRGTRKPPTWRDLVLIAYSHIRAAKTVPRRKPR